MAWYYTEPRRARRDLDPAPGGGGTGPPGPAGPAGPGVPTGGTTGQQLQKTSATDYATAWVTPPTIPTTLPPSGPAGGDLGAPGSTYPNPVLAAGVVTRAKTAPDCWLSPIPVDPANVGQVLMVQTGPALAWKDPPVTQGLSGTWNWRVLDGTGDPGARNLSPDVAAAPTFLRFSTTLLNGNDARNVLTTTQVGDILVMQTATDSTKWSKVQVNAPVVDNGTWFKVPATGIATGTGGQPANNADVVVNFQRSAGTTGPTGPAGGDLGAPGSTYPNPTIAPGVVTTGKLADAPNGVTTAKLNDGAVTDAKINDVAATKLTGTIAQARLPVAPSGLLTANVNDAQITDAKIAGVAWSKVTGAPTSYPPSGSATNDLSGSYPGPTVAKLNGAAVGTTTPLARGDILVADGTPALKRLALGAASTVLQSNGTDVVWGSSLGGPPSGPASGSLAGSYPGPSIAPSGVTAGTYGDARTIPTVTVNAEGRVTGVTVVTLVAQWK